MTRAIIVDHSATGAILVIHLRSLGACEINVGGTRLVPTAQTLFATALYLAVEGARPIPREQMLTLLWPDADEEKGTHSLRQMFYKLRTHGLPLDSDAERVTLPAGVVSNDYESLLVPNAVVPVGDLLERIPGGFLPGYMPRASRPFAEWVERQRAVVNSALRRQLVVGIDQLKTVGDWPATYLLAQRCLELDPLNEEATLALAEAMAMDGSKARAIMIIDRYMNEVGPRAPQLHLPATMLRKRISELYPLPPVIERDPPQTGRDAEMEKLDGALKDARQGSGSAFVISGPPGIGKTRLVTEFTRAAQLQGIPIARTGMGQHDNHRPLGAWSDLVPLLQRMPGALGCDPESLPYLKRLTTYDSKQTTPSPEAQDAEYLFARIRMSIIDLVSAVASESCLIVLIEDIHWMDEWSWDVMSALTKKLGKTGMLILMTRRDSDEQATPMPKDAVTRGMPLAPLDESRCRKLLGLVGPTKRVSEEDFVEWCVKTSAGNPYFLIELGRRASKADGRFQAPPSLTRLIAERFLDVTPLSRRVLQAAAVLGKNSNLARIEIVLGERRIGLLDSLDELSRHSLVLSDGERVVCRHDVLGMSALADISALSLRLVHRHAAKALESEINHSSTPSYLWDCARHWESGGDDAHALQLLRLCGSRAIDMGVPSEAVRVLRYALQRETNKEAGQVLRRILIRALYLTREYASLIAIARESGTQHDMSGDAQCNDTPEELHLMDAIHYSSGPTTGGLNKSLSCALEERASSEHRVSAALVCAKLASNLFTVDVAKRAYDAVRPLLNEVDPASSAELRMVFQGSFGDASACASAARDLRAAVRATYLGGSAVRAILQCAEGLYLGGLIDEALDCTREAAETCRSLGMTTAHRWSIACEAKIHLALGDTRSAKKCTRRARTLPTSQSQMEIARDAEYEARIAVLDGEDDRGLSLLNDLYRVFSPEWPRAEAHHTGLKMLPRIRGERYRLTDAEMQRVIGVHIENRARAHHDLFVYMLSYAFETRGEGVAFQQLAHEYVTKHRFERGPLLAQLEPRINNATSKIVRAR